MTNPEAAPAGSEGAHHADDAPSAISEVPDDRAPIPADELIEPWHAFEDRLRYEYTQVHPPGDEITEIGGGPKRLAKRALLRVIRPVVRRYDRLLADVGGMGLRTTSSLAETQRTLADLVERTEAIARDLREVMVLSREHEVRIGRAATELDLLADRLAAGVPAPTGAAAGPAASSADTTGAGTPPSHVLPDAFYWRFERSLRGSAESVTAKLGAYREIADRLRARHGPDALWLDLGCGEGRFMELLRDWGWRVLGMDQSPQAVEACAAAGLEAAEGDLPEFLLSFEETPDAISLIQVIEHLPTETWLPTLRYAERILASGGSLLIETIDPRNPEALQAFFADVTHTWAAHPETLRVMAGFAGFVETDVIGLNPDENGRPQDFVLTATKA